MQDDRERARREAADWCVRLNGRDEDIADPEFERWLARSALNRQLFSEMDELFRFGKSLSGKRTAPLGQPAAEPQKMHRGYSKVAVGAVLGVTLLLVGAATTIDLLRHNRQAAPGRDPLVAVLGTATQKRSYRLIDGSHVILDAGSRVAVRINGQRRILRLEAGRARFEVAHDGRPFIVYAGRGSVKAVGTVFDVTILADKAVRVDLLRGAVDVRPVSDAVPSSARSPRRLVSGESTAFDQAGVVLPQAAREPVSSQLWPEGLMSYKGEPLAQVIAEANRYGPSRNYLKVGGEGIAARPVYGTLRIDDPERLAHVLARSLELDVKVTDEGITLLAK